MNTELDCRYGGRMYAGEEMQGSKERNDTQAKNHGGLLGETLMREEGTRGCMV